LKYLFFISIFILSSNCHAQNAENAHREFITKQSFFSYTGQNESSIFFSKLNIEQYPASYLDSSGQPIVGNPQTVTSAYDSSIKYYVGNFYKSNNRYQFIFNILGFQKGQFFSVGYDNGVHAEKLTVNQSLFLGFSQAFEVTKHTLFNVGFGAWFGGNTSESPCVDSYDREYWCQNLTSWSDYKPKYPKPLSYIDFRILTIF